jgi:hypothetical protein
MQISQISCLKEVDALSKLIGDQERANEALDRVLLASRTGQSAFVNYGVPQEVRNYPKNLQSDRDIANFLFGNLLHQSGGNDAENMFRGHRRLYERYPEIYDPITAVGYSADEIRAMMHEVGLTLWEKDRPGRRGGKRPEWLLHNAEILNEHWGGDPRNIFLNLPEDEIEAWKELRSRIAIPRDPRKIWGIQDKSLALFVQLFDEPGFIRPHLEVPPAIDLQHQRYWSGLELITAGKDTIGPWKELNAFRDLIREMYREYARSRGVSMLEIGEAVWWYVREMCKFAPNAYTKNGQHVGVTDLAGDATAPRINGRGKTYAQICGNCIVSDLCQWNVPHNHHYNRGRKQGGLILVPRPKLPNEKPLDLNRNAQVVPRCTRHRGHYFDPDPDVGCVGCGRCGQPLDLPVSKLREKHGKAPTNSTSNK